LWATVNMKLRKKPIAFYIQPVVGPLGLPMLEFQLKLNCTDAKISPSDAKIVPCKYYSLSQYTV